MNQVLERTISKAEAEKVLNDLLARREEFCKANGDQAGDVERLTKELGEARLKGRPTEAIHKRLAEVKQGTEERQAAVFSLDPAISDARWVLDQCKIEEYRTRFSELEKEKQPLPKEIFTRLYEVWKLLRHYKEIEDETYRIVMQLSHLESSPPEPKFLKFRGFAVDQAFKKVDEAMTTIELNNQDLISPSTPIPGQGDRARALSNIGRNWF
jgi:hypothetical protein